MICFKACAPCCKWATSLLDGYHQDCLKDVHLEVERIFIKNKAIEEIFDEKAKKQPITSLRRNLGCENLSALTEEDIPKYVEKIAVVKK